jgi:D-threonate/D-erythronate kinase
VHGFFNNGWRYFDGAAGGAGLERALQTGHAVLQALDASAMGAIVVFGGDTAFGIHQALGAPEFTPQGEILPGVALSVCGGLFWITKAGGFGQREILFHIRRSLT